MPPEGSHSAVVLVRNASGLHARPSTLIARLVRVHTATLELIHLEFNLVAEGDSVISLLSLGAKQTSQIRLTTSGPNAEDLLKRVRALFESGFGEIAPDDEIKTTPSDPSSSGHDPS